MSRTLLEARQLARELLDVMSAAQRDSWLLAGDNIVRARRGTDFTIHLMQGGIYVEEPSEPEAAQ